MFNEIVYWLFTDLLKLSLQFNKMLVLCSLEITAFIFIDPLPIFYSAYKLSNMYKYYMHKYICINIYIYIIIVLIFFIFYSSMLISLALREFQPLMKCIYYIQYYVQGCFPQRLRQFESHTDKIEASRRCILPRYYI